MKKVIFFLSFLLAFLSGFTQVEQPIGQPTKFTNGVSVFKYFRLPDTTTAAPTFSIGKWGTKVFIKNGSGVWVELQGTGGGTGGDADSLDGQPAAYYLARANHTGTQAQSTVVGLVDSVTTLRNAINSIATNITISRNSTTVTPNSSNGTEEAIPGASPTLAGVMTATDKQKLDSVYAGQVIDSVKFTRSSDSVYMCIKPYGASSYTCYFQYKDSVGAGAGATNLAYTESTTQGTVTSDTGTDATIPTYNASRAGLVGAVDYVNDRTVTTRTNPTGTTTHTYGTHGAHEFWTINTSVTPTLAYSGMTGSAVVIYTVSNTSGGNITVTLPANSRVNGATASTLTLPTGVSGFALKLINGSDYYFLQDGASGQFFTQLGNSFGATAVLGTLDAYGLQVYTNGVARQAISSTGLFSFGHTTAGLPFDFRTSNAGNPIMRLRNTSATGYTAIDFDNDANLAQMGIGVSNSSAAANPQISYINMTNSPFAILYNATPQLYLNNSKNWGFGDGNSSPTARFDFDGSFRIRNLASSSDSGTYKPIGADGSGNFRRMSYWPGGGAGGGSSYYQTFLENGTPETQQGGANFRQVFTLTDGDGRTEIDFDDEKKYQPWYTRQSLLTLNSYDGFYGGASGAGSGVAIMTTGNTFPGWFGGVSLATGTTSTGYSYMAAASTATAGSVVISLDSNMRVNIGMAIRFEDIFDGTEDWNWHGGLCELVTSTSAITDGVYFRVSRLDSSGQLIACTEAGGTKTEDATGVTLAADTEYKLEITVFEGVAKFYITTGFQGTKTLVSTISTNVPQGSSQNTNLVSLFYKTAGTTSRLAYMRWMAYGVRDY